MSVAFAEFTTPTTGNTFVPGGVVWCHDLSKFVQVGSTGSTSCVLTSTDGHTWALQTASEGNQWRGLAYAPIASGLGSGSGRLVAVAENGTHRIMYSDNGGVSWTNVTAPGAARTWSSVDWSPTLGLFCAVAAGGSTTTQLITSSDGITWSFQTTPSALQWQKIVWADGRFMVTMARKASGSGTSSLMTSTNGTAWTLQTHPAVFGFSNIKNRGLCFSPDLGMWFALAQANATQTAVGLYSTDHGVTWTSQTLPHNTDAFWTDISWSSELSTFLILSGNPSALTSSNGTSWTYSDLTSLDLNAIWQGPIAYSSDLRIFVSQDYSPRDFVLAVSNVNPLVPTSGPANGQTALTLTGDGVTNGGFTRAGAAVKVSIGVNLASIYGVNLSSPYTIVFPLQGGTTYGEATNVSVTNATTLTCQTVNGKGSGNDVLVWDNNNTLGGPNILLWVPAGYTYSDPVVTSLSPSAGVNGTVVTLTGTNLFARDYALSPIFPLDAGTVTFDGVAATAVTYVNTTTITCVAPAHINGHTSLVNVVYTPRQLVLVFGSSTSYFTYTASTLLAAFTYNETWLNVNGTFFDDAAVIDGVNVGGDSDFVFNGHSLVLGPGAEGSLAFGGSTLFDFFLPSAPAVQRGGQWQLNSFHFKGRIEEQG